VRDGLYLFVDGDENEDDDDQWMQVAVNGVSTAGTPCGGAAGITLTTSALPVAVSTVNTPVRTFERMELRLYDDGAGQYWLGARSISGGDVNLQPVIGPLTADGFQLEYLDSLGNEMADLTAIKSIRLTVRGLTDNAVRKNGSGYLGHQQEALATQVLLRNSIRP
jgi:hypothetical protein